MTQPVDKQPDKVYVLTPKVRTDDTRKKIEKVVDNTYFGALMSDSVRVVHYEKKE